jgi:hypothetical protein
VRAREEIAAQVVFMAAALKNVGACLFFAIFTRRFTDPLSDPHLSEACPKASNPVQATSRNHCEIRYF